MVIRIAQSLQPAKLCSRIYADNTKGRALVNYAFTVCIKFQQNIRAAGLCSGGVILFYIFNDYIEIRVAIFKCNCAISTTGQGHNALMLFGQIPGKIGLEHRFFLLCRARLFHLLGNLKGNHDLIRNSIIMP